LSLLISLVFLFVLMFARPTNIVLVAIDLYFIVLCFIEKMSYRIWITVFFAVVAVVFCGNLCNV